MTDLPQSTTNMNATFKKRLIEISKELEILREDHEQWMEGHDQYGWEYTPAGEHANDEQYDMNYILDTMAQITNFDPREDM